MIDAGTAIIRVDDLSVRLKNALHNNGITTVSSLMNFYKTEGRRGILRLPYVSTKGANEIEAFLAINSLSENSPTRLMLQPELPMIDRLDDFFLVFAGRNLTTTERMILSQVISEQNRSES